MLVVQGGHGQDFKSELSFCFNYIYAYLRNFLIHLYYEKNWLKSIVLNVTIMSLTKDEKKTDTMNSIDLL